MALADSAVHVRCGVCRADDASHLFDSPLYAIVRCRRCGHRYVCPRPTPEQILAHYSSSYFENPAFRTGDLHGYVGYSDYFAERPHIEQLKSRVLARIERHVARGRLLDVGCGPGFFVDLAARKGWAARGIDVNEHAVRWARDHDIEADVATTADLDPGGTYDCVTLFDVLEHFEEPRQEVEALARVVRPGGLLVVATPNAGAAVSRLMGRHWMEMRRPDHFHFFDLDGLVRLLGESGFTAVEWHSIGKISTLKTLLDEARFYSPRIVGGVAKGLGELGWDQMRLDVDLRTKMCLYARRTPLPGGSSSRPGARGPVRVSRSAFRHSDATGAGSPQSPARGFRASQHRYWEGRQRFRDPRSPGPSAFTVPKLDWIARHVPLTPATSVLDVGAGNGTITHHLDERAGVVVGLDFSHNLLRRAPRRGRMVQGDAAALPHPDDRFDVVIEANALHHVSEPAQVLREMARVTRRHVVVIEPNRLHPPMAAFMVLSRPDWRGLRFDVAYIRRLSAEAGLRVVACQPQGMVYPNATPARLLPVLRRFDRPGPLGAYVVAVLEKAP